MNGNDVIKAYKFAKAKHAGQKYGDKDYFGFHVCGVVDNVIKNSISGVVQHHQEVIAFLHDVVEDTKTTFQEIDDLFGNEIMNDVARLTRQKGETYLTYIKSIQTYANSSHVVAVKIADLEFNIEQAESRKLSGYEKQRLEKYRLALHILRNSKNK